MKSAKALARRPSADAVFFATTLAPIQSDEHREIRRLPGDRAIVRGPGDTNENEAARLYLRDLRTRSDTLLVPLRSRLAYGGSIRFEPRSEALVARFYLSGSTVVFLDEPATPHHSAWSARRRLAPSVPWIAMGWVSFALAIYATRRCRSRNAGSIGHSPYRAGQQTEGDDTIGRHERATTLWAVSSALLFLTPIVFALCAGMVAR